MHHRTDIPPADAMMTVKHLNPFVLKRIATLFLLVVLAPISSTAWAQELQGRGWPGGSLHADGVVCLAGAPHFGQPCGRPRSCSVSGGGSCALPRLSAQSFHLDWFLA
jgi:hypothetical protein